MYFIRLSKIVSTAKRARSEYENLLQNKQLVVTLGYFILRKGYRWG